MKRKMLAVRKLVEAGATRSSLPTAAPNTLWPTPLQERGRDRMNVKDLEERYVCRFTREETLCL